jgi:hypothetical protein
MQFLLASMQRLQHDPAEKYRRCIIGVQNKS